MLKKSASILLASFRSSTYPTRVRLRSSLSAALLDSLFEHLRYFVGGLFCQNPTVYCVEPEFFRNLLGLGVKRTGDIMMEGQGGTQLSDYPVPLASRIVSELGLPFLDSRAKAIVG